MIAAVADVDKAFFTKFGGKVRCLAKQRVPALERAAKYFELNFHVCCLSVVFGVRTGQGARWITTYDTKIADFTELLDDWQLVVSVAKCCDCFCVTVAGLS